LLGPSQWTTSLQNYAAPAFFHANAFGRVRACQINAGLVLQEYKGLDSIGVLRKLKTAKIGMRLTFEERREHKTDSQRKKGNADANE
jgi:hypothetical protein